MRTANNNFTVEALVAKYRNFVMEHASFELIGTDNDSDFIGSAVYGLDGWPDHQLLITLYNDVAGENADTTIQDKLSKYGEYFWEDVLSTEEYAFLRVNFKETVRYIFSEGLLYGSEAIQLLIDCDTTFVKEASDYVQTERGKSVYIEDDVLGDWALLFPQCVILCDNLSQESALKKIRLFAEGIKYRNIDKIEQQNVDIIISGAGWFPGKYTSIETFYSILAERGIMIIKIHPLFMASTSKDAVSFRKCLVFNKSLKAIIKDSNNTWNTQYVLILEKFEHKEVIVNDRDRKLSRVIPFELISDKILLPGYYLVEKPDHGIPMSDLLDYVDSSDKMGEVVSKEQPLVFPQNLGTAFKEVELGQKDLKKRKEYIEGFDYSDCFNVDFPSVLLYGGTKDVYVGLTSRVETPYSVLKDISCFTAKKGIDLQYIACLLFDPIVAKQISALYLDFYYGNMMKYMPTFLNSIIVPNHRPKERYKYLANACYNALSVSRLELKQENVFYKKAVSMRKHALTQSLSAIEAMFYALNSCRIKQNGVLHDEDIISRKQQRTVRDAFDFISQGLKDMMPALDHISAIEYSFGRFEWIDPEKFIEEFIKKNINGWLNFKPITTWKQGHNMAIEDLKDPSSGDIILRKGDSLNLFMFPKDALERVFKNIISNAIAHGFNDKSRDDYQLKFSWYMDGMALVVEIENNGSPIPNDRDTASLLEYGVSTDLHHDGHNGIGCNEINDIMQRYDGKVEIVSSPKNYFTVKYVLTFKRSKTIRSFKL